MCKTDKYFYNIFCIYRNVQIICLILMSLFVFLQVVLRELFSVGIQWAYELSCFMQITMVWLGMPILLMKDTNVQITVLYDIMPVTLKRVLNLLKFLVIACCMVFLTWGYVLYIQNLGAVKSSVLRLPNWIFYGSMPFGIGMSIAVIVFKAKQFLHIDCQENLDQHLKEV